MNKVVDTIKIEKLEGGAFNVVQGDRYADELAYDEMLGLVSALTIAKEPMCLSWMKTKEEHEQHLAIIRNMPSEVEFEDILVPGMIEIYMVHPSIEKSAYGDGLFIKFGNKQFLGVFEEEWIVNSPNVVRNFIDPVQCKLIPCNRDELKVGDTAFSCNIGNFDCTELLNYCKVISDLHCVCIDDRDVRIYGTSCFEWYKVVPVCG